MGEKKTVKIALVALMAFVIGFAAPIFLHCAIVGDRGGQRREAVAYVNQLISSDMASFIYAGDKSEIYDLSSKFGKSFVINVNDYSFGTFEMQVAFDNGMIFDVGVSYDDDNFVIQWFEEGKWRYSREGLGETK